MKIKVLLLMPGKEPQIMKIPASRKFIQSFIGENLIKVKLSENVLLISNEDAPREEFNRILKNNIILGNFFIIGVKNNHFISLKKRQINRYSNMFKLEKHQKKIERYKEEYLEEYYFKRRIRQELIDNLAA